MKCNIVDICVCVSDEILYKSFYQSLVEFCTEQILERQFGTQNLPTIFPITFHIYRGKRQKNNEALNVLDSRYVSTSKKHLPNHILCLQTNLLCMLHFQQEKSWEKKDSKVLLLLLLQQVNQRKQLAT